MHNFLLSVLILIGLIEAVVIWATVDEVRDLKSRIDNIINEIAITNAGLENYRDIAIDTRMQLDEEIQKRTNDYMCHMRDMQGVTKKLNKISREIEKGGI